MTHPNQSLIDRFFAAYAKRDVDAIRQVMSEDVEWIALGEQPLAGVKKGLAEVITSFDQTGAVMGKSNPHVDRVVVGANNDYLIECQHVQTHRGDGHDLDQMVCVLWTFANGKIVQGTHFYSDPQAADAFFRNALAGT
jgi:ketosteroid isomerase-like protein